MVTFDHHFLPSLFFYDLSHSLSLSWSSLSLNWQKWKPNEHVSCKCLQKDTKGQHKASLNWLMSQRMLLFLKKSKAISLDWVSWETLLITLNQIFGLLYPSQKAKFTKISPHTKLNHLSWWHDDLNMIRQREHCLNSRFIFIIKLIFLSNLF